MDLCPIREEREKRFSAQIISDFPEFISRGGQVFLPSPGLLRLCAEFAEAKLLHFQLFFITFFLLYEPKNLNKG